MKRSASTIELNTIQQKAVKDASFPSYLQAGAGSGKTRVLVEKIVHIVKTKPSVSLENFAVITFTNKATDELAARLQSALYQAWIGDPCSENAGKLRLQIAICNMVDVSTIHSFCEKLLRRYGPLIGIPNTFEVKSFRQETRRIVTKHVNQFAHESVFNSIAQYKIVELVMELLQDNSNKGLTIDSRCLQEFKFDTKDNNFFNDFKRLFTQIYSCSEAEIAQKKSDENVVAVNDLITLASKLLENPQIGKRVARQYKYLFVDEFQDTNYEQFIFIEKMIENGVKVFVIGDKKQSIYAFRGADVENSDRIDRLLKDAKRKNLNINYRTDPRLLKHINTIFASEFLFEDEPINFPHQTLDSGVELDQCDEPFMFEFGKNITAIVSDIVRDVQIGGRQARFEDIAILCRRNADVDYLGKQLKAKGIPVEIIGGKGFYANTEIIDTYKLFNAVIYKGTSTALEARNTFYFRSFMHSDDSANFESYLELIDGAFKSLTVENILGVMFAKSHALEYLRYKRQYQAVANLLKLKAKARELTRNEMVKPLQFLEYLDVMITSGKDEDEAEVSDEDRRSGVVSLYSIHKAKGLEFPIVIIPNCDMVINRKTILPRIIYDPAHMMLAVSNSILERDSGIVDKDYTTLLRGRFKLNFEEELRIFYVACTRAKNMLVLSCRRSLEQVQAGRDQNVSWAKWVLDSEVVKGTDTDIEPP